MPSSVGSGARLRGRTATQRSKKGSEKVLGRVLGEGSQKGSEKGAFVCGFCSKHGVPRRGSEKGVSRRCLERPLGEYDSLGVRAIGIIHLLQDPNNATALRNTFTMGEFGVSPHDKLLDSTHCRDRKGRGGFGRCLVRFSPAFFDVVGPATALECASPQTCSKLFFSPLFSMFFFSQ